MNRYARQRSEEFGRHNRELQDEYERERMQSLQGGHGQSDPRSDAQRGREDWVAPRPLAPRRFANEGLASDFSLEGTHNFAREERRSNMVSHRGKGPKGYLRSDERIHEFVSEALADHHDIDASDIEVTVKEREVTLVGTVNHRSTKRLVEDVVEAVSGVEDIHNQLRVKAAAETKTAAPASQRAQPQSSQRPH